ENVFEVQIDQSRLIPDEDQVFEVLMEIESGKRDKFHSEIRKAYTDYNFGVFGDEEPLTGSEAMRRFAFLGEQSTEDPFSTALSEDMKNFVEYLVREKPELARELVQRGNTAAHLGPVEVVGPA